MRATTAPIAFAIATKRASRRRGRRAPPPIAAARSRARKGRAQFRARHLAPLAGLERAQLEPADPHALQARHLVADPLEQPPHFTVSAAPQLDDEMRLAR